MIAERRKLVYCSRRKHHHSCRGWPRRDARHSRACDQIDNLCDLSE